MKSTKKYDALIVIRPTGSNAFLKLYSYIVKHLDCRRLLVSGQSKYYSTINAHMNNNSNICLMSGDDILSYDEIYDYLSHITTDISLIEQFYCQILKIQYSTICNDEFYLIWDPDLIPCRNIKMYDEISAKPYLDAISCDSEYIMVNTKLMYDFIKDVENNESIPGHTFWQKLFNSTNGNFNVYRAYTEYVKEKAPSSYIQGELNCFNNCGEFISIDDIKDKDILWLSKDFDTIILEDNIIREEYKNLLTSSYYQDKLSPKQMLEAILDESSDQPDNNDFAPENRLKYLNTDTYMIYEELGDSLINQNNNQAFLCYENAIFLCENETSRKEINTKLEKLISSGKTDVNKTAFIVISYNNLYLTKRCIESIYTNCNPKCYLLMIFDNGSSDGSQEWLAKWGEEHEEAIIILNDTNLGFGGGNNACCEYLPDGYDVFYLNNDTRIPANALFWMRMGLYKSDDIGGVGAIQNYAKADQLANVEYELPEQYLEYGAHHNVYQPNPYEEQSKICGFAFLISREMYETTGGFDEQFNPGFLEDDDLSLQIRSHGKKLILCQNAFIYHAGSQSFRKRNDVNELFRINREKSIKKWGFDPTLYAAMSENEYNFSQNLSRRGYNRNSSFSLVHIGSGCGNMLGHIHYLYPNAILAGVEENSIARRFAISCIPIYSSTEELPMPLENYDVIAKDLG